MAAPPVSESWAIAVHEALTGIKGLLIGQLVPDGDAYELVLTTRDSPPSSTLVELVSDRLGPVLRRDDSPLEAGRDRAWCFYPALDDREHELFLRLDWPHAVVLHEWVD
jgi:hypothetical protein